MNIGLTGGIASGKSTVAAMLSQRGAIVIDADQIARDVVVPGGQALEQITAHFGTTILQSDGTLNRKKLGGIVFNDPNKRKALEAIIHPLIRQALWEQMRETELLHPAKLVVVDVPLLYESQLQANFQQVVVVYVPEEVQLERLMARDQLSLTEAKKRLESQLPIEFKKSVADEVIDNSGSLANTTRQVDMFWQRKGLK